MVEVKDSAENTANTLKWTPAGGPSAQQRGSELSESMVLFG